MWLCLRHCESYSGRYIQSVLHLQPPLLLVYLITQVELTILCAFQCVCCSAESHALGGPDARYAPGMRPLWVLLLVLCSKGAMQKELLLCALHSPLAQGRLQAQEHSFVAQPAIGSRLW